LLRRMRLIPKAATTKAAPRTSLSSLLLPESGYLICEGGKTA